MINALLFLGRHRPRDLTHRYWFHAGKPQALHRVERTAPLTGEPQHDRHFFPCRGIVQQPGGDSGRGHVHHRRDVRGGESAAGRLFIVHFEPQLGLR